MTCAEDVAGLFALRSLFALYSADLDERSRCEAVLDSELDERRFFYNAIDFIASRTCLDGTPHILEFTIINAVKGEGDTQQLGFIRIEDQDGLFVVDTATYPGTALEIADYVYQRILQYPIANPGGLTSDKVDSVSLEGATIRVAFSRGSSGKLFADVQQGTESRYELDTTYFSSAAYDPGQLGGCSDCSSMANIISILFSRLRLKCDKKTTPRYVGPCPPDTFIACDQLGSGLIKGRFWGSDVPNPGSQNPPVIELLSPQQAAYIYYVDLDFSSPVQALDLIPSTKLFIKDLSDNDEYELVYAQDPANPTRFRVASVLPNGQQPQVAADDIEVVDGQSFLLTGPIRIRTIKGNWCSLNVASVRFGYEFKIPFVPTPFFAQSVVERVEGDSIGRIGVRITHDDGSVPQLSLSPGAVVQLKTTTGAVFYEWIAGSDPLISAPFPGENVGTPAVYANIVVELPKSVHPMPTGSYLISFPAGLAFTQHGKPTPAIVFWNAVSAASNNAFTYTFPFNLA